VKKWLLFLLITSANLSCTLLKPTQKQGTLVFEHTFCGKPFVLNTPYITLLGDTVVFTKLKYYVSRINLAADKNPYWLIDTEQNAQNCAYFTLKKGTKPTELSFGIGIDSIANKKGAQKGALDPLQGMFWTWEQGYAFLKAEGYYVTNRVSFVLHVGMDENYTQLAYPLKQQSKITIQVAVEKMFGGYAKSAIDLHRPTKPLSIMAGEKTKLLKRNIEAMFKQGF